MKLGYQDVGSVTLLKYAPLERVKAGWLYLAVLRLEDGQPEEVGHLLMSFAKAISGARP